jgi:outer membrane receptor protein involved in Fe transport
LFAPFGVAAAEEDDPFLRQLPSARAGAGDVTWATDEPSPGSGRRQHGSPIRLTQAAEPAPAEPAADQPAAPSEGDEAAAPEGEAAGGYGLFGSALLLGMQSVVDATPVVDAEALDAALIRVQHDAATLLQGVPGITVEPHASNVHENTLRGRRLGQIPGKGSYWFPARQDLDTMMSKIDSQLVDRIVTYYGPYSALYGPGFGFFEVELLRAPHYDEGSGFQAHAATALQYETNGEQWLGRQGFWGGDELWGFRGGYSHRGGSDYETGRGDELPASYKSRQADLALGSRLTDNSTIDFQYLRLDQTDLEFPGQFFDINALVTDAYAATYVLENQELFDVLSVDGWYNRTDFYGDNLRPGKRRVLGLDRVISEVPDTAPNNPGGTLRTTRSAIGFTDVAAYSTGFRMAFEWGDRAGDLLTAGVDLRYLSQRIDETNQFDDTRQQIGPTGDPIGPPVPVGTIGPVSSPLPKGHSSNPGLFSEWQHPLSEDVRVRMGSRVDWVAMNADQFVPGVGNIADALGGDFDQDFNLGAAFLTTDVLLTNEYSLNAGVGFAMRPPTMTEMYTFGPFVAVLPQYVFTSVFGDPNLDPEQMMQVDVGLSANYGDVRSGLQFYHAWVEDYITFDFLDNTLGSGAYAFVNTPLATLAGCEAYGEADLAPMLTAFGTMSFVEGRDHSRSSTISRIRQIQNPAAQPSDRSQPIFGPPTSVLADEEPLPVIAPLASRLGFRLHAPELLPAWNIEFAANVVDNQDRVARSLRELLTPGYTTYDILGFYRLSERSVVTAGVRNLTDKYYQTYFDTRQAGTSPVTSVFQPGVNFVFGWEYTR